MATIHDHNRGKYNGETAPDGMEMGLATRSSGIPCWTSARGIGILSMLGEYNRMAIESGPSHDIRTRFDMESEFFLPSIQIRQGVDDTAIRGLTGTLLGRPRNRTGRPITHKGIRKMTMAHNKRRTEYWVTQHKSSSVTDPSCRRRTRLFPGRARYASAY
jgi:hypothetical protein